MKKVFGLLMATSMLMTGCMLEDMGDRTEKMHKLSQKLESYSSCMKRMNAGVMYKQMRSGNGAAARKDNFEAVIGESGASGIGKKITRASVYFKGFEHQLFSGLVCAESKDDYRDLELNTAKEFSQLMSDYSFLNKQFDPNTGEIKGNILKYTKVKNGDIKGKTNDMMSFFAFAVAMHQEHHFQKVLKRNGTKKKLRARTFYDILKEALRADASNKTNEIEMQLVAGPTRDTMINLLRARYNYLAVIAVGKLIKKEDMNLKQKLNFITDRFLNLFGVDKIDIEIPLTHMEDGRFSTLRYAKDALDGAIKVRNFMNKMGITYRLDDEISEILNDVHRSDFTTKSKKTRKEFNEVQKLTAKILN